MFAGALAPLSHEVPVSKNIIINGRQTRVLLESSQTCFIWELLPHPAKKIFFYVLKTKITGFERMFCVSM